MGYKIDTLSLRRFSRVYASVVEDDNQIFSSVYLDLKNQVLRFVTSRMSGMIKIKTIEAPGVESGDEFFLPGDKFFAIVSAYAEAIVQGDTLVAADGSFDLAALHEEYSFPDFSKILPHSVDIPLIAKEGDKGPSLGELLSLAASFSAKAEEDPQCGVFVKGKRVIGTDRFLYLDYEASLASDLDVAIPLWVWESAASLPYDKISLSWDDDGHVCVRAGENSEVVLLSTSKVAIDAPDPADESFRPSFAFATEIIVPRAPLVEVLKFFDVFTKSAPNNRIRLVAPTDKELRLEILDGALAHRSVTATVSPDLVSRADVPNDLLCLISAKNLLKALETVGGGDTIRLGIERDGATVDVRAETGTNHVAVATLE
jgi:hypothetical protein